MSGNVLGRGGAVTRMWRVTPYALACLGRQSALVYAAGPLVVYFGGNAEEVSNHIPAFAERDGLPC